MLDAVLVNWPLKAIALIISIILWFFVLGTEDPQTTQAVTVPVKPINIPQDLAVISISPETVELRVRGRQSAFRNTDASRAILEANLRNAKVGENEVALRIARLPYALSALPGYATTATVQLDKVIQRARPVQYVRRGEPAGGFIIDSIAVAPDEVTVVGATSIVSRVARVVVVVDTSGLNSSVEFEAEVEARDNRDVVVNGVRFQPERVQVTVTVRQVRVKTVPVRPVLGDPPSGWRVAGVSTTPLVVTVTGEQGLGGVESVSTIPLDISGLRGSKTYSVPLNVPAGLSVLGPAAIEVTVTTRSTAAPATEGGATGASGATGGGEPPAGGEETPGGEDIGGEPGNQPGGPTDGEEPAGGGAEPSEGGGASPPPTTDSDDTATPAPERPGP